MIKARDFPVSIAVAVCITAAALTAISATAHQDDAPIDLGELQEAAQAAFAEADADNDGAVSSAEFESADIAARGSRRGGRFAARMGGGGRHSDAVFDEADADDDGQLSKEEYDAMPEAVERLAKRRLFNRLDADDDGWLSAEEFPSRYTRLLALDANGDGQITGDEMPRKGRHHRGRR